jgi:hypothetical protein
LTKREHLATVPKLLTILVKEIQYIVSKAGRGNWTADPLLPSLHLATSYTGRNGSEKQREKQREESEPNLDESQTCAAAAA